MAKYFNTIEDKVTGKPVAGALVYVLDAPSAEGGTVVALEDDSGAGKSNPVETDQTGFFSFNVSPGNFTLEVSVGGLVQRTINNVGIGIGTDADVANKANASALGTTGTDTNMGAFTSPLLPDNETAKDVLEALAGETASKTALASTSPGEGASLIGIEGGGGTVQDAIFVPGRATPVAGSKMAIDWLRDDPASPMEDQAGIWFGPMLTAYGFNKVFEVADGGFNAPSQTLFVRAENAGSAGDIVAITQISVATTDDVTVFGGNILAVSTGNNNVKLVGLEIDVEPSLTDTNINNGSGGLFLNAFSHPIPGPAMLVGGVGGGSFNNGIVFAGLAAGAAGLALEGSGQADSLINTTVGTYNGTAVTLGTGTSRGILFAEDNARIYYDGTNVRQVIAVGGNWIFRDAGDATTLVSIDGGGNLLMESGGTVNFAASQAMASATAGSATLPANPVGFLQMVIAGTARRVPYYAA